MSRCGWSVIAGVARGGQDRDHRRHQWRLRPPFGDDPGWAGDLLLAAFVKVMIAAPCADLVRLPSAERFAQWLALRLGPRPVSSSRLTLVQRKVGAWRGGAVCLTGTKIDGQWSEWPFTRSLESGGTKAHLFGTKKAVDRGTPRACGPSTPGGGGGVRVAGDFLECYNAFRACHNAFRAVAGHGGAKPL